METENILDTRATAGPGLMEPGTTPQPPLGISAERSHSSFPLVLHLSRVPLLSLPALLPVWVAESAFAASLCLMF